MNRLKIAVVGHVEHVTLGSVAAVPKPGEIVHMQDTRVLAGGGGGLAFSQLVRSDAEVHLFTAVGNDEAGAWIRSELARSGEAQRSLVTVHVAVRAEPHPRVVVMVDGAGKRTIVVTRSPLQPRAEDPLPWSKLAELDAVFFTGDDPRSLELARAAPRLIATARRKPVVEAAGVSPDALIGSFDDPRENAPYEAYAPPPAALVLSDGARPMRIVRASGTTFVDPPARVENPKGDYGAGDSFAGAFTYFVACGLSLEDAVRQASPFGAAVLRGIDPRDHQAQLLRPSARA